VPPGPSALTAWVKNLLPSAESRAQSKALIHQLGDDDFSPECRRAQRETA
jgi:hypothetical protein